MKRFKIYFANFVAQLPNFAFFVADWVLAINSKYFRNFSKCSQFPNILSFKSFGNTRGNKYIDLLEIIT